MTYPGLFFSNGRVQTLYIRREKNRVQELDYAQKGSKKHQIFEKQDNFLNIDHLAKNDSPSRGSLQNGQRGSKIKNAENMRKTILQ